jgi:hypothetical protein
MKLLIRYIPTLLCLCLLGGISQAGFSQEVRLSVNTFEVGQWQDESFVSLPASAELQAWGASKAQPFFPKDLSGSLAWEGGELVQAADQRWTYHTLWKLGTHRLRLRFSLWEKNGSLLLPEVGSYQACLCEDCETLDFVPEGRACSCDGPTAASYLMGESLH